MGVNKTISLDAQTALIAERLPNFSQFVRQSLRNYARIEKKKAGIVHVAPESGRIWGEEGNKCNPRHRNGECMVCWGGK